MSKTSDFIIKVFIVTLAIISTGLLFTNNEYKSLFIGISAIVISLFIFFRKKIQVDIKKLLT